DPPLDESHGPIVRKKSDSRPVLGGKFSDGDGFDVEGEVKLLDCGRFAISLPSMKNPKLLPRRPGEVDRIFVVELPESQRRRFSGQRDRLRSGVRFFVPACE